MVTVLSKAGLFLCAIVVFCVATIANASEFHKPWHNNSSSIVLDAYEYTAIDWSKIKQNKRLVGFINKASDGLSPSARCRRDQLCRAKWRRYVATMELYHTRRHLAKTLGLKWGAYHLGRPGNPIQQAQHFLHFAKPDKDDLIAIDIEHNDPKKWMSLKDAEIFSRYIKRKTGRYPVLYTNHSTARYIALNREDYPLLSRLNLWYARYKPDVRGVFPMGNWKSYSLWQFSSMVNCNNKTCPWRIAGAGNWIDVNVVKKSPDDLRADWPLARLTASSEPVEAMPPQIAKVSGEEDTADFFVAGEIVRTMPLRSVLDGEATLPKWRPGTLVMETKVRPSKSTNVASRNQIDRVASANENWSKPYSSLRR